MMLAVKAQERSHPHQTFNGTVAGPLVLSPTEIDISQVMSLFAFTFLRVLDNAIEYLVCIPAAFFFSSFQEQRHFVYSYIHICMVWGFGCLCHSCCPGQWTRQESLLFQGVSALASDSFDVTGIEKDGVRSRLYNYTRTSWHPSVLYTADYVVFHI